jgi:DNA-binding NarL/FixJ family response regulator
MRRRVLIVDDHAEFRALAKAVLEIGEYVVVAEAADGEAGVRAVAEHHPDVVLLDVYLPDGLGFDFATSIIRGDPAPAIVLTSSHDVTDFGSRIAGCGARGFIPKTAISPAAMSEILG